ncbi:homeodomain-like protein [Tanacetum coccineum]
MNIPSKEDLDNLCRPMYKEYFKKMSSETSINYATQQVHNHEDSPSTSSIIVEEHEAPPIVTTSEEQTSSISLNEADEFNQEDSANFNEFIMAQPQRQVDVHQDELCPPNKRYALMDANKKIDLEHLLCPNENKILTNILQNQPIRFSIVASSSVPMDILRQFWQYFAGNGIKIWRVASDLETVGALQFQLGGARSRLSWRQFILALGLHTDEEMKTIRISSARDFLSTPHPTLVDFIILDMPEDIKVPLILGRPFLSTARAKIDVYKRKITLRVGEERIVFTSVKPASSLIKRVYMLSLRERMELDLEARLMGETLVLNRSLDPFLEDYIELNDLNEPFELRRNQGDDLMPTIKEGEVIEEFRTRDDKLNVGIDDYPSYCDYDKKIHIDCAHNLKFSCMIGFEFTHANFFSLLYVNVMSKKFHNSIMKEKLEYKGNNVVGALMNIPIFVGTFSVMTDFAILENMDAYRDEGPGDVIFSEPFLREVGIKTRRFEGMITIYNGDDEVTYQMVRSHPRPWKQRISMNIGEEFTNLEDPEVLES